MTEPFRNKKTAGLEKFAEIGVTQLSDVINKTIIEDLEQQKRKRWNYNSTKI